METEQHMVRGNTPEVGISASELYAQGARLCGEYSAGTRGVRTLAQHVLLGFAVSIGFALSRSEPPPPTFEKIVLVSGGAILCVFAVVLWILNHHYSLAFEGIRDTLLIPVERASRMDEEIVKEIMKQQTDMRSLVRGPFGAHEQVRKSHPVNKWFAWNLPFLSLLLIGMFSVIFGCSQP